MAFNKKRPPTPWRKTESGAVLYQDARGRCSDIVYRKGKDDLSGGRYGWHVSGPNDRQEDGFADNRKRAVRHVEARAHRWGCRVNRLADRGVPRNPDIKWLVENPDGWW